MHGGVHGSGSALDRFEVEPGRRDEAASDVEDDHPAHLVQRSVQPGAAHVPLRPDGVSVHRAFLYLRSDVGHSSEDLLPVAANPRNWGTLTIEVAPLVSPILLLIRSAAGTDPDMARLLVDTDQQRLKRMTRNARALTGHLRPGITQSAAAEILWTYSSPDLYDLLVVRRRWQLQRYGRFIADSMIAVLLP